MASAVAAAEGTTMRDVDPALPGAAQVDSRIEQVRARGASPDGWRAR